MDWFVENLEIARDSRIYELDEANKHGVAREHELYNVAKHQAFELHNAGFSPTLDDCGHAGETLNVYVRNPNITFPLKQTNGCKCSPSCDIVKCRVFSTGHTPNDLFVKLNHKITHYQVFRGLTYEQHAYIIAIQYKCGNICLVFGQFCEWIKAPQMVADLGDAYVVPFLNNAWMFLLKVLKGDKYSTIVYFHSGYFQNSNNGHEMILNFEIKNAMFPFDVKMIEYEGPSFLFCEKIFKANYRNAAANKGIFRIFLHSHLYYTSAVQRDEMPQYYYTYSFFKKLFAANANLKKIWFYRHVAFWLQTNAQQTQK